MVRSGKIKAFETRVRDDEDVIARSPQRPLPGNQIAILLNFSIDSD
jgi:hypothetical protein